MNYQGILKQFSTQGLSEGSVVTQTQMGDVMNKLVRKNSHNQLDMFNPEVAREIWDECQKDHNGMVNAGEYAQVLLEAKNILEDRLRETTEKLNRLRQQRQVKEGELVNYRASGNEATINGIRGQLEQLEGQIQSTELDLQDYNDNFKDITSAFFYDGGNLSRQNISINRSLLPTIDPHTSPNIANTSFRGHSQIFMKRSSTALSLVFYLGILVFFLELFITMHKVHFLTLLATLALLAIFGLNYFDRAYIRLVLGLLFVSVLFEIFWFLFYVREYGSPNPFSQNSLIHTGWLRFTIFLVVVSAVLKVIIFLILMGYHNVQEASSITVFGYTVSLTGECLPLRSLSLAH